MDGAIILKLRPCLAICVAELLSEDPELLN